MLISTESMFDYDESYTAFRPGIIIAQELIRNLTSTDEVSNIKKSLVELNEEWLCSEAASEQVSRATMISHFNAMMTLLTAVESSIEVEVL